jgi:ATP-dependent DNA helicase RecQ
VIFHDATLRQIAQQRPATLAELGRISGIGENKLTKYGDAVLAVVDSSVSEAGPGDQASLLAED